MKLPHILVQVLFLLGLSAGSADAKPNFVVFFADDLGYGDVGYQGGDVSTPHIDSIARNGTVFTDGYVTCPVCAPSRAGLLTGRYQQSFGFWDNIGPYRRNPAVEPGIPADLPILSERLKALGYVCGLFGKTHDGDAEAQMAFNRWDEFYGFNNGASNYLGDMNRPHNPIWHNKTIASRPYEQRGISKSTVNKNGVLMRDRTAYLTDELGDHAVRFIEEKKGEPFLVYLPFNAIHGPFQAHKEEVEVFADEASPDRRLVKAMLASMDANIGKVLEALRRNGLEEKTLVLFLSDNGGHEASPNKPLRGKKASYWEGGLRVPFCVQWKGTIGKGKTVSHPVISLDILPTLVEAAGGTVKAEWELDGFSLLPLLQEKTDRPPHDALYWVWGARKAIRRGPMKAMSQDGGKNWQLYNLVEDLGENEDLARERPQVLRVLVAEHGAWEQGLMPQQWGWNKALGVKDPLFGKLKPYHAPGYFDQEDAP